MPSSRYHEQLVLVVNRTPTTESEQSCPLGIVYKCTSRISAPNTTAFLQPMDAGIIAAFKRAYRIKQLRWVYDKIKRGEKINEKNVYKVDQLQAMSWSKEIWQEMQGKSIIENCFRHTGIVFNGVDESSKEETSYGPDLEVEDIIIRAAELSL